MSNQFTLSHPNNKMSIDEGISTNYKQIIIDSLDVLRKRDVADKAVFSARAYVKVITQLKNYNSITELLPNKKDAVVILVQIKNKHNGH